MPLIDLSVLADCSLKPPGVSVRPAIAGRRPADGSRQGGGDRRLGSCPPPTPDRR